MRTGIKPSRTNSDQSSKTTPPRLAVMLDSMKEFSNGCFFTRHYVPFIELNRRDFTTGFVSIRGYYTNEVLNDNDIVIFTRVYNTDPFRHIWKLKSKGMKIVYELDDDVWCYSDDTEVLTVGGWKKIVDVEKGEKIYSYNADNDVVEEATNQQTIVKDYEGEMVKFTGESVDLLTTPNHRMIASMSKGANKYNSYEMIEADKLVGEHFRLKKNANWTGKTVENWDVPTTEGVKSVPIELFLKFLGYYISEGSWEQYRVTITQKRDGKYYNEMKETAENIADVLGLNVSISEDNIRIHGKSFANYIKDFTPGECFEKRIPQEILDLSPELLTNLFDSLMQGDGSENGLNYYTASAELRDDMVLLANKLGWSAAINIDDRVGRTVGGDITNHIMYCVHFNKRKNQPRFNHHKEWGATVRKEEYNGRVACLYLDKNHTLLVRRNGKSVWSGNSIPNTNPAHNTFETKKHEVDDLCREADAVIVSTEPLAELIRKIKNFDKPVYVCPNAVNREMFKPRSKKSDRLRIGWTGGANHYEDLDMLLDYILELDKEYDFDFVIQGLSGSPLEAEMYNKKMSLKRGQIDDKATLKHINTALSVFDKLNQLKNFYHVPFYPPEMYPQVLSSLDLDIGLAFTTEAKFNRSKSAIKFYEYAAVGTTTIASNLLPYKNEVQYIAWGAKEWKEKLSALIEDKQLRDNVLKEQQEYVFNNRDIQVVGRIWEDTYKKIHKL